MPREVYLSASGIPTTGDQSSAVAQWAYTNRGSILVIDPPPGQMYTFGGIALDSNYSGTRVRWEGYSQLPSNIASPGVTTPTNYSGGWVGIVVGQADEVVLENVMYHGNRLNMADNEHVICIGVAGATNLRIANGWRIKEVRGDAIYVGQADWQNNSANPQYIDIGDGVAMNSADDGRNAISIVSCSTGTIGKVRSVGVGGVVGGVLQPGGLDIEPDFGYQSVTALTIDQISTKTAGTSGLAVLGKSVSGNDSNRDWNCAGITIKTARIIRTGTSGPGLAAAGFTRCADIKVLDGEVLYATTAGAGVVHDFSQRCEAKWKFNNVTYGTWLGALDSLQQSRIDVEATNFTIAPVRSTCTVDVDVHIRSRGSVPGSTAFGVQTLANSRGSVTQTRTHYRIEAPYDGNLARAFRNEPGDQVLYGVGTEVRGGDWTGYSGPTTTIDAAIPKRNVPGLMRGASYPQVGTWAVGDVYQIAPPQYNATTGKVLGEVLRLTTGSGATFGVDWINNFGTSA